MSHEPDDMALLDVSKSIAFVEDWRRLPPPPLSRTSGDALTVLQPHSDDAALSIGGLLNRWRGQVHLVTAYSGMNDDQVRAEEDAAFAAVIGSSLTRTNLSESSRRENVWQGAGPDDVTSAVSRVVRAGTDIAGPVGVGSHPDHLSVFRTAVDLGARLLWEDVAFWGIYAASVEDRLHFSGSGRARGKVAVAVEISVEAKIAALDCYPSQSADVWRPIRYSRAVAQEHDLPGFCERVFVQKDELPWLSKNLGSEILPLEQLRYGTLMVDSFTARLDRG